VTEALCSGARVRTFAARSRIYGAQTPPVAVYAVRSGLVKLATVDAAGREHVLTQLQPGAVFGCEVVTASCYCSGATALEEAEVCVLRREDVAQALQQAPQLVLRLLSHAHTALWRARAHQVTLGMTRASARLARHLTEHMEPTPDGWRVRRTLTLAELGAASGMSPETACRILGDFETAGVIDGNREVIRVLNVEQLRKLAHVAAND
jgi:CRP/FNR family transcriptional regulator